MKPSKNSEEIINNLKKENRELLRQNRQLKKELAAEKERLALCEQSFRENAVLLYANLQSSVEQCRLFANNVQLCFDGEKKAALPSQQDTTLPDLREQIVKDKNDLRHCLSRPRQ